MLYSFFCPANIPVNSAELFWSCYFDNTIAHNFPTSFSTPSYALGSFSGVDSQSDGAATLNSSFGIASGGTPTFITEHVLDEVGITDVAKISEFGSVRLEPSTAPGGKGNQLVLEQKKRFYPPWNNSLRTPQLDATIQFANGKATPREFFYSFMVKIPDNLADIFVRNDGFAAWAEIHAVKCWSANSNDARISIIVSRLNGETGFRLKFQFDNCGFNESTLLLDGVITPYWYDYTDEGTILAGEWYNIFYYFKRPAAGKDDLLNGRAQCVLTRLATDEQIVVTDRIGGTSLLPADAIKHVTNSGRFWGYYEHEFTRYIFALCYSGGFPATGTMKWIYSNIEFWTKRPYLLI